LTAVPWSNQNLTNTLHNHVSCVGKDSLVSSTPDFVGINEEVVITAFSVGTTYISDSFHKLVTQLENATVPTWLSMYSVTFQHSTALPQDSSSKFESPEEALQQTALLYNRSNEYLMPNGPLSGGNRFQW
jgi:hypothetical protein